MKLPAHHRAQAIGHMTGDIKTRATKRRRAPSQLLSHRAAPAARAISRPIIPKRPARPAESLLVCRSSSYDIQPARSAYLSRRPSRELPSSASSASSASCLRLPPLATIRLVFAAQAQKRARLTRHSRTNGNTLNSKKTNNRYLAHASLHCAFARSAFSAGFCHPTQRPKAARPMFQRRTAGTCPQ